MKGQFLQKISGSLSRTAFKLKKASPELLIIGGAIGVVGAAIGACCATRKLDTILEEHKKDVESIREYENNEDFPEYTHKDAQHDLTVTYARTSWKIVKLYAPSVLIGVASLGCMLASNQILRKRNAALAAAYTAVDSAFKKYRKNVVERFGEEVDKELRFNTKKEKIEQTITDENGKEKKVKQVVNLQQKDPGLSDYAVCFEESNWNFTGSPDANRHFLTITQSICDDMLNSRGYLFLNEVYDKLGFPRTKAGQIVGWVKGKHQKDGYVDFGLYDYTKQKTRDFINGYEPAIWLDFNVDGPILDYMNDR